MTDTLIHESNRRNFNQRVGEYHESTGQISGKSVSIDPKWKPLFIACIILGLLGLVVAGCGIAAVGVQQNWWSIVGLLNQVNQTKALITSYIGGVLGTVLLIVGIVGLVKTCRKKDDSAQTSINVTQSNIPKENQTSSAINNGIGQDEGHGTEVEKKDAQTNSSATAEEKINKIETQQSTNRKGRICITTQTGGYIGHPTQRQFLPLYLKDMTLADGSPLLSNAEDFFCELYLFNMSRQLKNSGIPSTMYLPGALFKGKKDGDSIRLRYKSKLIELTIEQQNHGLKFAKGTFEDVFAMQTVYIEESCDVMNPLFDIYDPYWFYRLGDSGVVYKLKTHRSTKELTISHLKEGAAEDFRPKIAPVTAPGNILLSEDKTKLIFVMEFCRFEPQDFDIVLNETHLIIYGRFENRPLSDLPVDLTHANNKHVAGNTEEWQKIFSCSREAMFALRWYKMAFFKGRSIKEMKTIIKKSSLLLYCGILQLEIPLL